MKKLKLNYDVLIKISRSLSKSKDPEEIIRMTVESLKSALDIKGCALFLINHQSKELELASSTGLSSEYCPINTSKKSNSVFKNISVVEYKNYKHQTTNNKQ